MKPLLSSAEKFDYLTPYKNKTILVTGAAGYIGSSVLRRLGLVPCRIKGLIKEGEVFNFPREKNAEISVVERDIRDSGIWKDLLPGIEILFHFAAQTSSKFANENPRLDAEVNLFPVINLIETCRRQGFSPRIIFSGTVTEVGFTETYPINETSPDLPITVYDINKLAAEKYLQYYSNQLKNLAVILRLANVYGPGPRSGSADRGILNAMTGKALRGEPLTVYGDGNLVRDYIYIEDVADAFLAAGAKIDVLKGNYYVIGSGVGHTIKEAMEIIRDTVVRKTKQEVEIQHVSPPENLSRIEYRNFVADTSRFQTAAGWNVKVSLPEGIERLVEYLMEADTI